MTELYQSAISCLQLLGAVLIVAAFVGFVFVIPAALIWRKS